MDLNIAAREDSDPVVVALAGELDMTSAPTLEERLDTLFAEGRTRVVVDLSELAYCGSTGLSTFVRASRNCTARGGYLRLAAPTRHLSRVLTVAGLGDSLPAYQTVEAAAAGA